MWASDAFGWFLTGCGADTMQVQQKPGGSLAGFKGRSSGQGGSKTACSSNTMDLDRFERPLQDNPFGWHGVLLSNLYQVGNGATQITRSLGPQRRSASWRISSLGRRFGQNRQHRQAILALGWVRGGGIWPEDTDLIAMTRGRGMPDERNRTKDRPHDQQLGHRNLPGRGLRRRAIFIAKIVRDGQFGEYPRLPPAGKEAPLRRRPYVSGV